MLWIYLVRSKLYEFKQVSIALEWLHDLGADEIINETPFNRFEIDSDDSSRMGSLNQNGKKEETSKKGIRKVANDNESSFDSFTIDSFQEAQKLAESCENLEDLFVSINKFSSFNLIKKSITPAVLTVKTNAKILILNEPEFLNLSENEIEKQKRKQILLRNIFKSIGLTLENGKLYFLPFFPWKIDRDEANANNSFKLMEPFLLKHIKLINPKFLVTVGIDSWKVFENNVDFKSQFSNWSSERALRIPSMDILISAPERKRLVWKDLSSWKTKLKQEGIL